jgi:hypothetical protein
MPAEFAKLNNRELLIYVAGQVKVLVEQMKDHETRLRLTETALVRHQTEADDQKEGATKRIAISTIIATLLVGGLDFVRHWISGK